MTADARRPRVAHIITRLDAGGAAANTLASVALLPEQGFDTALVHGRTGSDPERHCRTELETRRVPVRHLSSMVREVAPLRDLAAFCGLYRYLRRESFDLVHTHCSKAGAIGRVAARCAGLPCVHTPHGHVFYGYFGVFPTRFFVAAERRLARITHRLVSLTDRETREALQRGIGVPSQYCTIPSGVPLQRFRESAADAGTAFRSHWQIPADALLVLSAGRLVPVKGFDILLRAFAGMTRPVAGVVLAIAGDGEKRGELEALAGELGIASDVRFLGRLPDLAPALGAADLFALASRNEGMGRVLAEAMAAGVAVAATRVGGIPELVRHGETGVLVPAEDPRALAEAMSVLARDAARRGELVRCAAASVYPRYDQSTMIERIAALYREVLRDR